MSSSDSDSKPRERKRHVSFEYTPTIVDIQANVGYGGNDYFCRALQF